MMLEVVEAFLNMDVKVQIKDKGEFEGRLHYGNEDGQFILQFHRTKQEIEFSHKDVADIERS